MAGEGLIQVLLSFGYTYEGQCNCDGFKTYKYRNKEYQFRWRLSKGQFKIKQHGVTKLNWQKISGAEETLNQLHNVAV